MTRTTSFILTMGLLAGAAQVACAQEQEGPPAPPRAAPADPDPVARAMQLIAEMIEAYKAAPYIVDTATWESRANNMITSQVETEITIGQGTDVAMKTFRSTLVAKDDRLYLWYPDFPDRYLEVAMQGDDVMTALVRTFGQYGGALAPCALRHEKPLEEIIAVLCTGLPDKARLSGYREITDADGRRLEQITLISPKGSAEVNVDPETKLIARTFVEWVDPKAPIPNFRQTYEMRYRPVVHEESPRPIEFETAGLTAFRGFRELRGLSGPDTLRFLQVKVDEAAPDFTLSTVLGASFSLSQTRGSVVLLVFWSSWDAASRISLQNAVLLRDWARKAGVELEVWPVHVLARQDTPGEIWENVVEFMDQNREKFSIESLLDAKSEVAERWGVTGVPLTMLIDREGTLRRIGLALGDVEAQALMPDVLSVWRGEPVKTPMPPAATPPDDSGSN